MSATEGMFLVGRFATGSMDYYRESGRVKAEGRDTHTKSQGEFVELWASNETAAERVARLTDA